MKEQHFNLKIINCYTLISEIAQSFATYTNIILYTAFVYEIKKKHIIQIGKTTQPNIKKKTEVNQPNQIIFLAIYLHIFFSVVDYNSYTFSSNLRPFHIVIANKSFYIICLNKSY